MSRMYPTRFSTAIRRVGIALSAGALAGCEGSMGQPTSFPPVSQTASAAPAYLAAPRQLYLQAQANFGRGDFDRAVDEFTQLIHFEPRWSMRAVGASREDLLRQRGVAYLSLGFPDTAIDDFTEVLRNRSDNAETYALRGSAYLQMDELYRAMQDCTDSIRLRADNPTAYRTRGEVYFRRGDYARAVVDLRRAQQQAETPDAQANVLLREALYRLSNPRAAAGDQAEAQRLSAEANALTPATPLRPTPNAPEHPLAGESSAEAAPAEAGSPSPTKTEVLASSDGAQQAEENAALRTGFQLLQAGDYEGAILQLTEAINAAPRKANGYGLRAQAWLQRGDAASALGDLRQAVRLDDKTAGHYRLKAEALLILDNSAAAEQAATQAILLNPSDGRNYVTRAKVYRQSGKFDEAIQDLNSAAVTSAWLRERVRLQLAEVYRQRGRVHEHSGRRDAAQADFRRAEKLGWSLTRTAQP